MPPQGSFRSALRCLHPVRPSPPGEATVLTASSSLHTFSVSMFLSRCGPRLSWNLEVQGPGRRPRLSSLGLVPCVPQKPASPGPGGTRAGASQAVPWGWAALDPPGHLHPHPIPSSPAQGSAGAPSKQVWSLLLNTYSGVPGNGGKGSREDDP